MLFLIKFLRYVLKPYLPLLYDQTDHQMDFPHNMSEADSLLHRKKFLLLYYELLYLTNTLTASIHRLPADQLQFAMHILCNVLTVLPLSNTL